MELEWEESKRQKTLKERYIDFADADMFFDGRPVFHQQTPRAGEKRWKSTALMEDRFFTIIWVWREGKVRIISMRRSHEKEERKYRQLFTH